MDKLIIQEQIPIKGTNLPQSIEKTYFESLNKMLQLEISQVTIAEAEPEVKINLADDVMRLLQVREKNKDMTKDWLIFISTSNFKLTAGEIYLAFKMALSRELLDSKGNEIELFPELSINTTGKVLHAYLKKKQEDVAYQRSKDKLRLLNKKKEEDEEENKKKIRENFISVMYQELKENGFYDFAWIIYDNLYSLGFLVVNNEEKKKLYNEQLKIYTKEEKDYIKSKGSFSTKHLLKDFEKEINSNKKIPNVINKCKSILVSNYLIKFTEDFETFKKQIPEEL